MTEDEFTRAVVEATKQATREVAKIHRRRLVLYAVLTSVLAAAAIAFTTTVIVGHHDCRNITALAAVDQAEAEESATATRNFEAKSKDRFGLTQQNFDQLIREGKERRERHLAALRRVAKSNCSIFH